MVIMRLLVQQDEVRAGFSSRDTSETNAFQRSSTLHNLRTPRRVRHVPLHDYTFETNHGSLFIISPIMAAFAVTAIQGLVTQVSELRLAKRKIHEGIKNAGAEDSADVVPHAEYVERYHRRWASSTPGSKSAHPESGQEIKEDEQQERRQQDVDLKEEESELTVKLIEGEDRS